MRRLPVLLLLPLAALAAVEGTVINRTTGKPQPGTPVVLIRMSQAGMEPGQAGKTDAQGKFRLEGDAQGMGMLQATYQGVTYNHLVQPGAPTTGLEIDVYDSSRNPGAARVSQHLIVLEPSGDQLGVTETFFVSNGGKTTHVDPARGTLQFYRPPEARGGDQVSCTAAGGVPLQRAAEKTARADVYRVDFPVRPGETRFDVKYLLAFANPGVFRGRTLQEGAATRLIAPRGVTLTGDALTAAGVEPSTQAAIYNVSASEFEVQVAGSGSIRSEEESGPGVEQILPRVYDRLVLILGLAAAILILGFVMLLRRGASPAAKTGK